jgi:hypothetical protein
VAEDEKLEQHNKKMRITQERLDRASNLLQKAEQCGDEAAYEKGKKTYDKADIAFQKVISGAHNLAQSGSGKVSILLSQDNSKMLQQLEGHLSPR